jgi:CBS-domain-containing membrane protein
VKDYTVMDLMVPLSEYATVPEGSTLFDAVLALEIAQEEFDHTKYRHRGILIMNKNNKAIGKLSQADVLRALEPKDEDLDEIRGIDQFGFSTNLVRNLYKQRRLHGAPLRELCKSAAKLQVEACMQTFVEGEYIDQEATLDVAIQHLILENHFTLLVTHHKEIVGILRLADVFAAVFHTMKECEKSLS